MVFAGDKAVVDLSEVGAPSADLHDGGTPESEVRANRQTLPGAVGAVIKRLVTVVNQRERAPDRLSLYRQQRSRWGPLPPGQHLTENKRHVPGTEALDDPVQPFRRRNHIIVGQGQDVAIGASEAGVEGEALSLPAFVQRNQRECMRAPRRFEDDLRRVVSRVVVDHDDLDDAVARRAQRQRGSVSRRRPAVVGCKSGP